MVLNRKQWMNITIFLLIDGFLRPYGARTKIYAGKKPSLLPRKKSVAHVLPYLYRKESPGLIGHCVTMDAPSIHGVFF